MYIVLAHYIPVKLENKGEKENMPEKVCEFDKIINFYITHRAHIDCQAWHMVDAP